MSDVSGKKYDHIELLLGTTQGTIKETLDSLDGQLEFSIISSRESLMSIPTYCVKQSGISKVQYKLYPVGTVLGITLVEKTGLVFTKSDIEKIKEKEKK